MNEATFSQANAARAGNRMYLAQALVASRARTLELLADYVTALGPQLRVPYALELNPPLWEVGHVAWFQEYWLARNQQRERGSACAPEHVRAQGLLGAADALYHSGQVAHERRWNLPLPDLAATRAYLADTLAQTLHLLQNTPETDDDLYFFRLALFHEDMHAEAAVYMAQTLDIALSGGITPTAGIVAGDAGELHIPASEWTLGHAGSGFAFDNELVAHPCTVAAFAIDAAPVTWQRYLPFVEAGAAPPPRYLRRHALGWQQKLYGQWQPLSMEAPAVHLSWFEADAWCRWVGRRLPDEAEWELAASGATGFCWGQVWEWTASRFLPYPGFSAHPYRDYSAPWFGERYVLRGAGPATSARMRHPRYRNYFTPERSDIHAGFRSCAPR